MRLVMLGTGNASVINCYNTCFAVLDGKKCFLVDAGGGNRILKVLEDAGIELSDIHDLFITHEHVDHLLGAVWLIRMIGQKMNQGKYEGDLRIYCHSGLTETVRTITQLTVHRKVTDLIGKRILLIPLEDGEKKNILGCETIFFDIQSTKARQFGFTMKLPDGGRLSCCGDEPYNACEYEYVKDSTWLLHEAFCMYRQADHFKPYEKHHSTVKEACELAEELKVKNLILYHTEEENLEQRKALYTEEGKAYYSGNLYVPDDLEIFEL